MGAIASAPDPSLHRHRHRSMRSGRRSEARRPSRPGAASPLVIPPSRRSLSASARSSRAADESASPSLPMADLMAYLQVVANNSSNLPLTRRDDPELGRTVSSLTPDEYETKCRAFVPANVRIIGGMFARYGRVWELPTSEEFDIVSNTKEPGLSHGGALCNALLKAMYDTDSDNHIDSGQLSPTNTRNASTHILDHKNLFDDDDDDETVDTSGYTVDRTVASFDTLLLNDNANLPHSLTWADMLRKMQQEIQGVGYPQYPALTSSYKFNLNTPFSLIPNDFSPGVNHKRALLIGCNYRRTPDAGLKASHDDIRSIKDFLVNVYGFSEHDNYMTVLMDDKAHSPPTHANITEAFQKLAENCLPGDAVFVIFTGHGGRVLDSPIDSNAESYDEVIIPSDYSDTGMIRDTHVFKTLFAPMRAGVTITCIIDCCHTGVMIDLPYLWTTRGDKGEPVPKMTLNNDFSFVRYLKVVKTLYESSVFTKIGKTVGSQLDKQLPGRDDETAIESVGSLVTMPEHEIAPKRDSAHSIFSMLTCQSPKDLANKVINCTLHEPEYSDDETLPRNNTMEDFDDQTHDTFSTGSSGGGAGGGRGGR